MTYLEARARTGFDLARLFVPVFIITAIAANVLTAQTRDWLMLAGRGCHLASIGFAVSLALAASRGNLVFIAALIISFVAGALLGARELYVDLLCILFLFAGALVSRYDLKRTTCTLQLLTLASGVLMFLQVVGVGEWTQYLNTAGGSEIPLTPFPTFLVPAQDLMAQHVQGRPVGLFHSNPFACLIVLVTLALTLSSDEERSVWLDISLGAVAVLTLAKAVYLGVALIVLLTVYRGSERQRSSALRFAFMFVGLVIAYIALFPGLTSIFMFNPQTFVVSVMTRIIDIGVTLAPQHKAELMAFLEWIESIVGSAELTSHLIPQLIDIYSQERLSIFTLIYQVRTGFVIFLGVLFLITCTSRSTRHGLIWTKNSFALQDLALLVALFSISLAANFAGAQLFWFFVGLAIPSSITDAIVDDLKT
ncbi:hypothetical protein Rleg4DRAFT_4427 [Rhizobium leguminosarum bv. trifolii WSM2297]|uniref:Uncharacterized protein n=1 Tax=Rhizobium leguminosarum bv. trifolii WSM2297 TaxID=754762 RepID=J0WAE3_RHILT|nr:hypothetical protein [Rhizobium leguminosarum]EJC82701.1 hypothetical protein Rleg4DRAFT_4427 [Rhizobium leguminosarum bv. trifolii WSM2297]